MAEHVEASTGSAEGTPPVIVQIGGENQAPESHTDIVATVVGATAANLETVSETIDELRAEVIEADKTLEEFESWKQATTQVIVETAAKLETLIPAVQSLTETVSQVAEHLTRLNKSSADPEDQREAEKTEAQTSVANPETEVAAEPVAPEAPAQNARRWL